MSKIFSIQNRAVLMVGGAILPALAGGGTAFAQVCVQSGPDRTVCRYLTATPRPLTIAATGTLSHGGWRTYADLIILVDGKRCGKPAAGGRQVRAQCTVRSPGLEHEVEARLYNTKRGEPAGVEIAVSEDASTLSSGSSSTKRLGSWLVQRP